jgi:hypothetical protein
MLTSGLTWPKIRLIRASGKRDKQRQESALELAVYDLAQFLPIRLMARNRGLKFSRRGLTRESWSITIWEQCFAD